jgi:hypothetical protein
LTRQYVPKARTLGREPRPLLLAECEELGAGQDGIAIDLGCGEGTDGLPQLAAPLDETALCSLVNVPAAAAAYLCVFEFVVQILPHFLADVVVGQQ